MHVHVIQVHSVTPVGTNGAYAHYVMVSKFQWKPIWLAIQRDPQNDWTATQNRVNYDVFAQAPFHWAPSIKLESVESCELHRFMAVR